MGVDTSPTRDDKGRGGLLDIPGTLHYKGSASNTSCVGINKTLPIKLSERVDAAVGHRHTCGGGTMGGPWDEG